MTIPIKKRNSTLRPRGRFGGAGVMMAIAAVMIAPDLIQDQAPSPQAPGLSQMIISPWTKFCLKGQEADAKEVCFTGKDGRVEVAPRTDRPPTDPEVFRAQQEKLQAELRKRAEDARKNLEAGQAR